MTRSSILHTPQDHDFNQLISELRESKLDHAADALLSEVAQQWQQGSSTVIKRSRFLRAQTELAQAVDALRQGKPSRSSGYKLELAQSVVAAINGEPVPEPQPQPTGDHVEQTLKSGNWIILGFEEGKYQASAGGMEVEAGTWQEALTELASKLSQNSSEQPSGTEYHFSKATLAEPYVGRSP
jgi:hypothetical protein